MERIVIHIKGRQDHRMHRELDTFYLGEYKVFDAIKLVNAKKGISESFKEVIRHNYNEPMIHVFEDDLMFTTSDARFIFENTFSNLPEDWDLFLGGSYISDHQRQKLIKGDGWLKMPDFRSLHNVIIRKSAYDKILSHDADTCNDKDIDAYLSGQGLNVYLCDPQVCIQYAGFSFNGGRSVDYPDYHVNMNIKFDENFS